MRRSCSMPPSPRRDAVDAYLTRREAEAEELRKKIEASQPSNAARKTRIKEQQIHSPGPTVVWHASSASACL